MTRPFVCGISLLVWISVTPLPALAQELPAVTTGAKEEPSAAPARTFVQTIKADLKSVASRETVSLLSIATAIALVASEYDDSLTYLSSSSTFQKTAFEPWARVIGQEWFLGTGTLATYAMGRMFERPRVTALGADLMEAQLMAGATTLAFKLAVSRTRPDGEPRSFPSGHASGTFATATVVQRHFGWKGAMPAYGAAAIITGARMQANSHYATDLIMGAALGILSGRAATFDLGARRLQISPRAVDGGAAVMASIH